MNNIIRVGISCIGSGVGQSVVHSLKLSRLPFWTVGFGTNPFAYGAYDCDSYDYTKSIYADDFVDDIIDKCKKHAIDILIPGLDDEVLIYAQHKSRFAENGIMTICSEEPLIRFCRDKELMSHELNPIVDVFVKSYSPDTYKEALSSGELKFPVLAKPRGGFASKGVVILQDEHDFSKVNSDHIIQELAVPGSNDPNYKLFMDQLGLNINSQVSEISIQLVYAPGGRLLGRMMSYNKLNNGIPIEILPFENDYVWDVIDKLCPYFIKNGLSGPLNIQGRLADNGLKLFELNPRFTGITGLRAMMGFNEVEACVKEWSGIDKGDNQLSINSNRFGVRQTENKSVSFDRNARVKEIHAHVHQYTEDCKSTPPRKVLISGAGGYLGSCIARNFADHWKNETSVVALSRDKSSCKERVDRENVKYIDQEDLDKGRFNIGNVDVLIHTGFARPFNTALEINKSVEYSFSLIELAFSHQVPAIINISSQSVYDNSTEEIWTEDLVPGPGTLYGQAKMSVEYFLKTLSVMNKQTKFSSLRLGTLAGGAPGLKPVDAVSKMVSRSLNGGEIVVRNPETEMQRLDIRDAGDALIKMALSNPLTWKTVYNLGNNNVLKLQDVAGTIVDCVQKAHPDLNPSLKVNPELDSVKCRLVSSRFYEQFNFKPIRSLEDTVNSLIRYQESVSG